MRIEILDVTAEAAQHVHGAGRHRHRSARRQTAALDMQLLLATASSR